jgi:hypothetical protein
MVKPKFDVTCDKRQMWLHWVRHTVFNFWLHHIYHHAYCVCYKKCRKSVPQKFNNRLHFNQNGAAQYNKRPSLKHATPAGVLNDAFPVPVVKCVSPCFIFIFIYFLFNPNRNKITHASLACRVRKGQSTAWPSPKMGNTLPVEVGLYNLKPTSC